jgi:prepilin-type N-terminal cleavage/methylation domain-containing protein
MKEKQKGFTLIELLVVIAIIGLLSSIVMVGLNSARAKGRDSYRRSSLLQVQKALELYYNVNGSYPSTVGLPGSAYGWAGDATRYGGFCYTDGCGGRGPYIPGLAPAFISKLPSEVRKQDMTCGFWTGNAEAGFLYNSDGKDYKFIVHCSIEKVPTTTEQFYDPRRPTWAIQVSTPGAINW